MQRFGAFALVAAMVATGGCASSAKYIEKKDDSGIVAVPDESNGWPNNNRRAALELIEKHVGPNYEIVDERTVTTGRMARTSLPDTNETLNPRNQAYPAKRTTGTAATAQHDVTQYRITYRKTAGWPAPRDLRSQEEPGLTPASGTVQTQHAPGMAPNVQPAGGPVSVFNSGSVRPASGADCNH